MSGASPWPQLAAVSGGAVAGAVLRWRVGVWLNPAWAGFPLGTLAVNCAGGLLVGLSLPWLEQQPSEIWRLLAVTGFLGGLTTFSAFSLESLVLLQRGGWALATVHALAHVFGALGCAALGAGAARWFLGQPTLAG